jgi:hypothetical protein
MAIQHPTGTYVIPMIASAYTLAAAVCSLMVTMIGMPLGRRNCIPQMIIARVICVSCLSMALKHGCVLIIPFRGSA